MTDVPVLETERLVLRGWRDDDVQTFAQLGNAEVMAWLGHAALDAGSAAATIERFRHHWERHGFGHWAVEERATGQLVGRAGLRHHDDWPHDPDNVEVGWMLGRAHWGSGFATEAALAALRYGFERVGAPEIISITRPENHRSLRVMEKLGLTYAGGLHIWGFDHVWYVIHRT